MRDRSVFILVLAVTLAAPASASELTKIYKRVQSSVVVIETMSKEVDISMPGRPVSIGGLGSGVLISDDGKILTAAHVSLMPRVETVSDSRSLDASVQHSLLRRYVWVVPNTTWVFRALCHCGGRRWKLCAWTIR